jgi:hypothetical protein
MHVPMEILSQNASVKMTHAPSPGRPVVALLAGDRVVSRLATRCYNRS